MSSTSQELDNLRADLSRLAEGKDAVGNDPDVLEVKAYIDELREEVRGLELASAATQGTAAFAQKCASMSDRAINLMLDLARAAEAEVEQLRAKQTEEAVEAAQPNVRAVREVAALQARLIEAEQLAAQWEDQWFDACDYALLKSYLGGEDVTPSPGSVTAKVKTMREELDAALTTASIEMDRAFAQGWSAARPWAKLMRRSRAFERARARWRKRPAGIDDASPSGSST